MDSHGEALAIVLDDWRVEQSRKEGLGDDDFFGAHFVLCDEILERIVSLAHHSRIPDLEALVVQTSWCFAKDYGPEILKIVREHFPNPPPSTSTTVLGQASLNTPPLPLSQSINGIETRELLKRKRTCKNCGSESHICNVFSSALCFLSVKHFHCSLKPTVSQL